MTKIRKTKVKHYDKKHLMKMIDARNKMVDVVKDMDEEIIEYDKKRRRK